MSQSKYYSIQIGLCALKGNAISSIINCWSHFYLSDLRVEMPSRGLPNVSLKLTSEHLTFFSHLLIFSTIYFLSTMIVLQSSIISQQGYNVDSRKLFNIKFKKRWRWKYLDQYFPPLLLSAEQTQLCKGPSVSLINKKGTSEIFPENQNLRLAT